ncbi:stage II sporulation protein M [Desulfotomaculum nigrificans CO-1-SRB]|uniref:Stage II sporulation protein M n=2 Tax=Desulfotomaculum nigrificans TaxID=1565 RepID=F6B9L9_DESCC|nr:stage II sporulation protein M [Desulfotomaculum nigrificans CO-1-SRB]
MYLVALVVLLAGLGCGSWGAHNLDQEQATRLTEYLDVFVSQVGSVQIDRPMLVKNTITNNIFFISIIYVLGLTVIGTPGILALLFARGFSLGFTLSFLTQGKTGQGILLALASVVPQSILLIPAVFMAGVAALSFSWLLIRRFLDSSLPVWPGIVSYHSLMLVVCCIAAAAGLVEAYITPELIKATISLLN